MNTTQSTAMKFFAVAIVGLSGCLASAAETRTEWRLVSNIDDIVNSSLTIISQEHQVVLVSDNGPYAISCNNHSNRGVSAVTVELNDDKSQLINPADEAVFWLRLDKNANNLISVNLMASDGGYIVNEVDLAISKAVPEYGDGWLFTSSSQDGVFYIEQRPMIPLRYICLKDDGERFNTDKLTAGASEMRVYLKREVEVDPVDPDPIDPDPVDPDPVKPEAPTFSLSDGVEADDNGWVDLSAVNKEIIVTLEAPEGCTAWYCLAYDGSADEPEFVEYTTPVHVEFSGELAFYSETAEGVRSEPKSLFFNGYTVTTGIDTPVKADSPSTDVSFDLTGRPVRPGHKGITITPRRKTIAL